MNKLYKLVVFDMDGVMFDTERIAFKAWEMTAQHFGFKIDLILFTSLMGCTNETIISRMSEHFGEDKPVIEWRCYMQGVKKQLLLNDQAIVCKPGLITLLQYLKAVNIKVAVASSNTREAIKRYLSIHALQPYIDTYVGAEDVINGKPDPEVFLKACVNVNVEVNEALVLEDAYAGICAARKAGIDVFFIPDLNHDLKSKQAALATFESLDAVALYLRGYNHV